MHFPRKKKRKMVDYWSLASIKTEEAAEETTDPLS